MRTIIDDLIKGTEFEKKSRIAYLKKCLSDTDYKAIKFAEGEISAEDYAEIKAQRKAWRDEINNLERN